MSKEVRPTFHSIPFRRSATYQMRHTTEPPAVTHTKQAPRKSYVSSAHMPALPDDEQIYEPTRVPSSTRRYRDTEGNEIIQQGNRRYVMHVEQPGYPKRRFGGVAIFGLGMIVMVLLFFIALAIHQNQQSAAQQDAFNSPAMTEQFHIVGHNNDSTEYPSYFEFINMRGRVLIVELPAGDPSKALIYTGPQILGDDAYTRQITATFEDVNGDGRVDMVIHIGDEQTITFLNNGYKFVPQP